MVAAGERIERRRGGWGDEEARGRRHRSVGSRSLLIKGERLPAEVVGAEEEEEKEEREEGYREPE